MVGKVAEAIFFYLIMLVPASVLAGTDVNLSWVAPSEREDNTTITLDEIAGYKIYYGLAPGSYNNSLTINDNTAVGHTFSGFQSGTYYFAVTTYDTDGRESQYSAEVKIVVDQDDSYKPEPLTNFKAERISGTLDYLFTYTLPTKFVNGSAMPFEAMSKLYPFDNNKWVKDINPPTSSFVLTLSVGTHVFDMEVETLINGVYTVSDRSEKISIVVTDIVLLPMTNPKFIAE